MWIGWFLEIEGMVLMDAGIHPREKEGKPALYDLVKNRRWTPLRFALQP